MHEHIVRENDYQIGKQAEDKLFDKLINDNFIVKTTKRYCWYDYQLINKKTNKKYVVELKKRLGINKNTYPTTLLPYSKIIEWRKVKKKYDDFILMFQFNNGTFYIPYSQVKKLAKTDQRIKVDTFTRTKGFSHNPKLHLYIPTEHLIPLEQLAS